ncbi:MAG: T9SS type A sorting domain-containing protein [Bacteroidota bacterium]
MKQATLFLLLFMMLADAHGQSVVWERSLEGSGTVSGRSVAESDGYLYAVGYAGASGGALENGGVSDMILWKLNTLGEPVWSRYYGGSGADDPQRIMKTADGHLIILGNTNSTDGAFSENHGGTDGFVMKVDSMGNLQWSRLFGGTGEDFLTSGDIAANGDLYLSGITESTDQGITGHGLLDGWMIRLSSNGTLLWQKSLGGSYNDLLFDVALLNDTSVIACGRTRSADQDILGFQGIPNGGIDNGWIIFLDREGLMQHQHCSGNTEFVDISFNTLVIDNLGRVLVGGEVSEFVDQRYPGNYRIRLEEFSGTLESQRVFTIGQLGNYELNQIVSADEDGYYLIGSVKTEGSSQYLAYGSASQYVARFSSSHENQWEYFSGLPEDDRALSAVLDQEKRIITCGLRGNDAWLTRLCTASGSTKDVFICPGDSIEFKEVYYKGQEVFFDTLGSATGCDSIVSFQIKLLPSYRYDSKLSNLCGSGIVLHDSLISQSGTYLFYFESAFHCDSIYQYEVDFVEVSGEVEVEANLISSLQSGALYQWYDCQTDVPVGGAVNQSFEPEKAGSYKVRVDVKGCLVDSECIQVGELGGKHIDGGGLTIFPNPADEFVILSSDDYLEGSLKILDMTGAVQEVRTFQGEQLKIDISRLPAGMYIIGLESEQTIVFERVLKNQR